MKDSTMSQEDDESEDEGLEEVLSGSHNLEQATLILSLCHGVFTNQFIFRYTYTVNNHTFFRENGWDCSLSSFSTFKVI